MARSGPAASLNHNAIRAIYKCKPDSIARTAPPGKDPIAFAAGCVYTLLLVGVHGGSLEAQCLGGHVLGQRH